MDAILIISGATATGKTSLSIEIANCLIGQGLAAEIVNFDSLLFYRELNLGTAKPSSEEQNGIKHHLIDLCSAKCPMNASNFTDLAKPLIEDLLKKSVVPILVGGSAFYIRALIKGMYESETPNQNVKDQISNYSSQEKYQLLLEKDAESAQRLHVNDDFRVTRALEHFIMTGEKWSDQIIDDPYDFSHHQWKDTAIHHFYLNIPKEEHWPIITNRTQEMIKQGLVEEVESLLNNGFTGEEKPLLSIGYKETLLYLRGEIGTLDDLSERISISTRQLAKSQRTFFKKIAPKEEFHPLKERKKAINRLESLLNLARK